MTSRQEIRFSVDSALLAELGERLVGQAHIALAELVKNSYDADATQVTIQFLNDTLVIEDNGHGMTFDEFQGFWMRIGTPHKQTQRFSREFQRRLTGSKGIGRLAVQFLAKELVLETRAKEQSSLFLSAEVNWNEAKVAGELTQAKAFYEVLPIKNVSRSFANESSYGTRITLKGLNQNWTSSMLQDLAREIWTLQPPFFKGTQFSTPTGDAGFSVQLETPDKAIQKEFEQQMQAVFELWTARIRGRLKGKEMGDNCTAQVIIELNDGTRADQIYEVTTLPQFDSKEEQNEGEGKNSNRAKCVLNEAYWEIRVFDIHHRQRFGIAVEEARQYLAKYGGVHVYDAGFHLPYYGPDQDWLNIERDHARRYSDSSLLPEELQVSRGMNDLPTQRRIFGIVQVDTGKEREIAKQKNRDVDNEYLSIQLSRDRLVNNQAYDNLVYAVRWSLDYYAMVYRRRQLEKQESLPTKEQISVRFQRTEEVIEQYKGQIPEEAYKEIRKNIEEIEESRQRELESTIARTNLLGTLATVGISSLAYQHELNTMYSELENITNELRLIKRADEDIQVSLSELTERIENWIERSKATRDIFSHMMHEENRRERRRFRARPLLENVFQQLGRLQRGVVLDTSEIDDNIRLPQGSYAEWTSVFQNVFLNAVNALLDVDKTKRYVFIEASCYEKKCHLTIQDNGVGIDLDKAENYFRPFERGLELSPERQALGIGGTGLGLTIVKMIAENLGCEVSFVKPSKGFSTAFELVWRQPL